MPMPEIHINRRLPAPKIAMAETIPLAERYHAYVNFGGLILTVDAPCGCRVHYDTSQLHFQTQTGNCLESCMTEDCDFEWIVAERAAHEAQRRYALDGQEFDEGGEG